MSFSRQLAGAGQEQGQGQGVDGGKQCATGDRAFPVPTAYLLTAYLPICPLPLPPAPAPVYLPPATKGLIFRRGRYKFAAFWFGAWRSLDSALPWGGRGRWFESSRSDGKKGESRKTGFPFLFIKSSDISQNYFKS